MDVTWCSTFSATTCLVVLQFVPKDICAASGVQGCVAADLITPTASSCVMKNCAQLPLPFRRPGNTLIIFQGTSERRPASRPHFHVWLRGEKCVVHPLLFLAMPSRRSDVTWHFQAPTVQEMEIQRVVLVAQEHSQDETMAHRIHLLSTTGRPRCNLWRQNQLWAGFFGPTQRCCVWACQCSVRLEEDDCAWH